MADDPRVRIIGHVADIDGRPVPVGVDFDTVSIAGHRLTRAEFEELQRLLGAASWEAADCGGRMAAENSDG